MIEVEEIKKIKTERQKIWINEPLELKELRKRKGTYDNRISPFIYAEEENSMLEDVLYRLRMVANKDVDLNSLRIITIDILHGFMGRIKAWYGLKSTVSCLNYAIEALEKIKNKNKYVEVVDELMLFVNKTNLWIDAAIPWHDLDHTFRWLVLEK